MVCLSVLLVVRGLSIFLMGCLLMLSMGLLHLAGVQAVEAASFSAPSCHSWLRPTGSSAFRKVLLLPAGWFFPNLFISYCVGTILQ